MDEVASRSFFRSVEQAAGQQAADRLREALQQDASVSVRLNPLKPCAWPPEILRGSTPVPWSALGRLLPSRPVFTLQPEFHGGAYYVQDSSAMFVGQVFRKVLEDVEAKGRPVRVLDLCAAPGGKTTDMASSLRSARGDSFLLVANEVMRNRAAILADNVARWGDPNVVVTNADPKAFAALDGWFDIIVADVPCSGEGMFRKDEEAVAQWSEDNVALCSARQRRIVADVWPTLAPGGVMVYSTCTFNREENAGNVLWICSELGASHALSGLEYEGVLQDEAGYMLIPGLVPGEGQYCAAVRKDDAPVRGIKMHQSRPDPKLDTLRRLFDTPVSLRTKGDMIVAVPQIIAAEADCVAAHAHVLLTGCAVGQMKGKDLVPDEDLALCTALSGEAFPTVEVDRTTALGFLHKDALVLQDAPRGHVILSCNGVCLGFVKNLGGRCNNLHPQGRRIMMDIK